MGGIIGGRHRVTNARTNEREKGMKIPNINAFPF